MIDILRRILPLSIKQGFGLRITALVGRSKWLAYPYYMLLFGKLPRGLKKCGNICHMDYKGHEIITPGDGLLAAIDIFQDKVYERQWSPRQGDIVFDVGSYVGMFAIRASELIRERGCVIAIEPEIKNYNYLEKNTKGLDNVVLVNEAMSDKIGEATFYLSNTSPCHSLIVKHEKSLELSTNTLDGISLRLGIKKVDFIKIDAEGAELAILQGAEYLLNYKKIRLAIASYHDLADGQPELPGILSFLEERGFHCIVGKGDYVYAERGSPPMRIAIVNDTIYPDTKGGAQKRVWELARRLHKKGHAVHLFGMKYWEGDDVITREGVFLHGVCPAQELYVNDKRSIREAIYFSLKVLIPLLKEKVDIVDCSNFPYFPCFAGKLHSWLRGSKLVITWLEVWHDYWYIYLGKKGILGKVIERLTAKLTKVLIIDAEHVRGELLKIGATKKIVRCAPDGVDIAGVNKVKPAAKNYDILYAGRLLYHKNVDVLVKAIGIMNDKKYCVGDVKCGIIGEGPTLEGLQKLTKELDLGENIDFLGFLPSSEDVFAYMKASKVFVHPSTREGCGLVTPEANACGLPVVAIDCTTNAASEIIREGENGYLCQLTPEDMADKILLAMKHRDYMSKRSRDIASEYDWDKITDKIESYYLETIGGKV